MLDMREVEIFFSSVFQTSLAESVFWKHKEFFRYFYILILFHYSVVRVLTPISTGNKMEYLGVEPKTNKLLENELCLDLAVLKLGVFPARAVLNKNEPKKRLKTLN